ncbi:AAA family ATPase [Streptomyces sp. NPDC057908]|uniref:AAA family ATPase n=1 Tax=Streptomyces sp. NPDC057908 TaxID=3346276 RepID=UPI0036EB9B3A
MNAIPGPAAAAASRPRRGPLPPPRKDHYLSLPDANVMGTAAMKETLANLGEVIDARGMMCLYGPAGLGKTMSVNASLRELAPRATRRIEFRGRPTVLDIRRNLFNVLGLPGSPPRQPTAFDTLLKDVLAEEFRVLVCDEAQWLREESFEYFRHLFDDLYTDIAVVFVGGGNTYQVLSSKDMLASRVHIWQEFRPLTRVEVLTTIPAYHPVWQRADPDDLLYTDDVAAHGVFRTWAKITYHVKRALENNPDLEVDRNLLRWVFSKLGRHNQP